MSQSRAGSRLDTAAGQAARHGGVSYFRPRVAVRTSFSVELSLFVCGAAGADGLMAGRQRGTKAWALMETSAADAVRRTDLRFACSAVSTRVSDDQPPSKPLCCPGARLADEGCQALRERRTTSRQCLVRGAAWRGVALRGVPRRCKRRWCCSASRWQCEFTQHARRQQARLSRLLPPPPPPAAHAMTGDRSGTGERSDVAHGVRGVRRRVGNALPSGGRDSCKLGFTSGSLLARSRTPVP